PPADGDGRRARVRGIPRRAQLGLLGPSRPRRPGVPLAPSRNRNTEELTTKPRRHEAMADAPRATPPRIFQSNRIGRLDCRSSAAHLRLFVASWLRGGQSFFDAGGK